MNASQINFTDDQKNALLQIEAAVQSGDRYLLTGHAGSGKTTLVQEFTRRILKRGKSIALTVPTHKVVSVLARKLNEAGIQEVDCRTIHSLLSLKPKPHGDRTVFERDRRATPVMADIVVVDECSMVDEELFRHIKRHLPVSFVLFVGDPAQLPPVNEKKSLTFGIKNAAHLTTIVRQAADNPILSAATKIRESQGGEADWSWVQPNALENGIGVFQPGPSVYRWMEKAFTSSTFYEDSDSFRYLAWTNRRVDEVNAMVRRWRYGDCIPTPFVPGERVMFTAPLIIEEAILFANNEEAMVLRIERGDASRSVPATADVDGWNAQLYVWEITLLNRDGMQTLVHMPSDHRQYRQVTDRIKDEAADSRVRWKHMHDLTASFAQLQAIYALTVHKSQGSTIANCFMDVPDIRRRETTNLLEAQQLAYVAATRASQRLILVGV